jgi:hypothetical protein
MAYLVLGIFLKIFMNTSLDFDEQLDKSNSLEEIHYFINQLPWLKKSLKIGAFEGYDGKGTFGFRLAGSDFFSHVAHEVAHALEIVGTGREKHLFSDHWGMDIKSTIEVAGIPYKEPQTLQATERECRVVGIQKRIMEMAGDPNAEALTGYMAHILLKWMPDWIFGGREKAERLQTRYDLIEIAYKAWDEERIVKAWEQVSAKLYTSEVKQETKKSNSKKLKIK